MKDRKFVNIDRDNFGDVMAKAAPRLAYRADNKLTGDGSLNVELTFKTLDDFEPANVARQVPAMKELLDMRHQLTQLLSKMEGNDKLEAMLTDILGNTEKAMTLAKELGVEAPKAEGTGNG
jgi:type VI secretion system protein ImpB